MMPRTPAALAQAASAPPTIGAVAGPMCHDTAMTWLVQAGYFEAVRVQELYRHYGPQGLYRRLYADPATDHPATRETIAAVPAGALFCLFDDGDRLQHTMVAIAPGRFAGTNNGAVGGDLNYGAFDGAALPWHEEGRKVGAGPDRYRVFWCTSDDVVYRFAALCAEFAVERAKQI